MTCVSTSAKQRVAGNFDWVLTGCMLLPLPQHINPKQHFRHGFMLQPKPGAARGWRCTCCMQAMLEHA